MRKFENDYTDWIIHAQIEDEVVYGESSGVFENFDQMIKALNKRGQDGWEIVSAWQRTEFRDFVLAIVWQREINAHN